MNHLITASKLLFLTLLSVMPIKASEVLLGNQQDIPGFSFPIKANTYHPRSGRFFVGAHVNGGKDFAVCFGERTFNRFFPLASEKVTLNGVAQQDNPVYDAAISHIALAGMYPLVITENQQNTVNLITSIVSTDQRIVQLNNMVDALGQPVTSVAALATNAEDIDESAIETDMEIFVAVRPQNGAFGEIGSGIAVGHIYKSRDNIITISSEGTAPLDKNSLVFAITSTLASMDDFVTVHSTLGEKKIYRYGVPIQRHALNALFIGISGVSNGGPDDGMHAVIATPIALFSPQFAKLAPDTAIAQDSIIATTAPNTPVSAFALKTMRTTTDLDYLIVAGGVGDPAVTAKTVYALPLISNTAELANVNALPSAYFNVAAPHPFLYRSFTVSATSPGQLYTSQSIPARVGQGELPGAVQTLFVNGQTVFASVPETDSATEQPGIFYSQALLDGYGCIKGWTAWQRAAGNGQQFWSFALDDVTGNYWVLPGASRDTVMAVNRTQWQAPTTGITAAINAAFTPENGGVQGLFEFSRATQGFDAVVNPLNVMIATGYKQLVLAQTAGNDEQGSFGPEITARGVYKSSNGSLAGFMQGVQMLTLSGGVLDELGAIVSADIVSDGTQAWFVVAGSGGVAILCEADGSGWDMNPGMGNGFSGLTATMSWKKIADYRNVRKIVGDEHGNLYVLTALHLERIALTPASISNQTNISRVILAQASSLPYAGIHAQMSDIFVNDHYALLASTVGVARVGNNSSIRLATNELEVRWTSVSLPESSGPVTRFFSVSPTGVASRVLDPNGNLSGNLYILTGYLGYSQASVYRFDFNYTGAVTDTTLQQLPDYFLQTTRSVFMNFGDYRNFIATDGALFMATRSKYRDELAHADIVSPGWHTVKPIQAAIYKNQIFPIPNTKAIGQPFPAIGLGGWVIPSDQAIVINQ